MSKSGGVHTFDQQMNYLPVIFRRSVFRLKEEFHWVTDKGFNGEFFEQVSDSHTLARCQQMIDFQAVLSAAAAMPARKRQIPGPQILKFFKGCKSKGD